MSKEFNEWKKTRDVLEIRDGRLEAEHKELGFKIEIFRYTDPERLHLADSAAVYLGKKDTDNIKRPLSIMGNGHALEIFRAESATFKYHGVSKQVYDHLITYKTLQARIAGGNRALVSDTYTMPIDRMKNPELVKQKLKQSHGSYMELVNAGESGQIARSAMPVNANMNTFKLQWNFQTLIESLFTQRIFEKGAQGLTVEVVRAMFWLCHCVDPELWERVFDLYGPHVKSWKEAHKRLRRKKITVREFISDIENGLDMNLEEAIRKVYGKEKSMWG